MGPQEHLWGILDPICIVFLFMIFAYFILLEAYVGWTIGKKILGMRVVDGTGNKIGLSKSLVRNLHVNKFNRLLHCQGNQKVTG